MLLRAQGVFISQEVIAEVADAPSSAESLAAALDDLDANGTWFGSGVTESSLKPSIRQGYGQRCCLKWVRGSDIGYASQISIMPGGL
jgi:hypothetical protein